jgi:hypothetical protein
MQYFAQLSTGQWLQIPEAFRAHYEQAGATLHPAPDGTPPVEVPIPLQASSAPSAGEGSDLGKGAGSESSPAVLDADAELKREVAIETARRAAKPPPRHDNSFIAPSFSVGLGKALRCAQCRELYSPRRHDRGLCAQCQRDVALRRRASA